MGRLWRNNFTLNGNIQRGWTSWACCSSPEELEFPGWGASWDQEAAAVFSIWRSRIGWHLTLECHICFESMNDGKVGKCEGFNFRDLGNKFPKRNLSSSMKTRMRSFCTSSKFLGNVFLFCLFTFLFLGLRAEVWASHTLHVIVHAHHLSKTPLLYVYLSVSCFIHPFYPFHTSFPFPASSWQPF